MHSATGVCFTSGILRLAEEIDNLSEHRIWEWFARVQPHEKCLEEGKHGLDDPPFFVVQMNRVHNCSSRTHPGPNLQDTFLSPRSRGDFPAEALDHVAGITLEQPLQHEVR